MHFIWHVLQHLQGYGMFGSFTTYLTYFAIFRRNALICPKSFIIIELIINILTKKCIPLKKCKHLHSTVLIGPHDFDNDKPVTPLQQSKLKCYTIMSWHMLGDLSPVSFKWHAILVSTFGYCSYENIIDIGLKQKSVFQHAILVFTTLYQNNVKCRAYCF